MSENITGPPSKKYSICFLFTVLFIRSARHGKGSLVEPGKAIAVHENWGFDLSAAHRYTCHHDGQSVFEYLHSGRLSKRQASLEMVAAWRK